ncbi:pentapeptide repeat-containing protein [Streptomyces europaeiscabiei]|uniref:pentapeptide repeat-containing protein n=1 Tax=Streptomyces europaeiscabiei TaxID=146819 RepID=UPI0029BB2958|nr:pentapeptide repeat-containing protein [Streptomyces europaeiscabiei]MDX3697740.1 pentapeptide repeat-containing protein [Streptomyces europaeiscabiei]
MTYRATPFGPELLRELLLRLKDPATQRPRFGNAQFGEAQFTHADFEGATFTGEASFHDTKFDHANFQGAEFAGSAAFFDVKFGWASFQGAVFSAQVNFAKAEFADETWFTQASFGTAIFQRAKFRGRWTGFKDASFTGLALFEEAVFAADVNFTGVAFTAGADLNRAVFEAARTIGPLRCEGDLVLSGTVFGQPVTIEVTGAQMLCRRTRWDSTATLILSNAGIDITDAILNQPVAVLARPAAVARVDSVRGVNAEHLVLTGVDLSRCVFSGAFNLDQLRLEGRCAFAATPTGVGWWRGVLPYRWTRRQALAEEHHWRALQGKNPAPPEGWTPRPDHPGPVPTPGPDLIAANYRQLRKAFEDRRNEPDSADFYYGEMEMRRHDRQGRTRRAERGLLWAYWLLSGYGLRASRALAWLVLAMTATVFALMLWGLPAPSTTPLITGPRAEQAIRTALNSVIFRSAGSRLSTAGTYIEMASRLLEPILLALAVLAVRSRVKR